MSEPIFTVTEQGGRRRLSISFPDDRSTYEVSREILENYAEMFNLIEDFVLTTRLAIGDNLEIHRQVESLIKELDLESGEV